MLRSFKLVQTTFLFFSYCTATTRHITYQFFVQHMYWSYKIEKKIDFWNFITCLIYASSDSILKSAFAESVGNMETWLSKGKYFKRCFLLFVNLIQFEFQLTGSLMNVFFSSLIWKLVQITFLWIFFPKFNLYKKRKKKVDFPEYE